MLWIGRPMSATELKEVFDREQSLEAFSYHLTSLAGVGVLELVEERKVRKVRGAKKEQFYDFTSGAT
jgi:hypothetical protein